MRRKGLMSGLCLGGLGIVLIFLFLLMWPNIAFAMDSNKIQDLSKLEQVLEIIEQNYVNEIDRETLIQGALEGIFDSLGDPYSEYLSEEELRDLMDTTTGEFGGIGLYISKQEPEGQNPGYVDVVSPIEGTPAYKAGIMAGDKIIKIEEESTSDMSMDEVLSKLRGKPGTEVSITIQRGSSYIFSKKLKREIIEIPTVRYQYIPQKKIGIIRIIQFTPKTPEKVKEALMNFIQNGYSALLIDLRSNPGGLLDSVLKVADFFFDDGLILREEGRTAESKKIYNATSGKIVEENIPIVVIANKGTASAGEILSGVLKDRKRALLVGEKTYGKGSVQIVNFLPGNKTGYRLTIAKYYTPSGQVIDKKGITPDIEIKEEQLTEEELKLYGELIATEKISNFVIEHKISPTEKDIKNFIDQLKAENSKYDKTWLKRLIYQEILRRTSNPPLYNPDFDSVQKKAIEILEEERSKIYENR
ncbi:S41 family peptidase [Spirochaetia bacterium 38H-sp]|uniref:S41 family peptidase n=1 Tax=Rarispira pelagica TaxID=3141764 RepID=A0ABU9U9A1_9SPIR